jgi:hypothetical protein
VSKPLPFTVSKTGSRPESHTPLSLSILLGDVHKKVNGEDNYKLFSSYQSLILQSYHNSWIEEKNLYLGPKPEEENSRRRQQ